MHALSSEYFFHIFHRAYSVEKKRTKKKISKMFLYNITSLRERSDVDDIYKIFHVTSYHVNILTFGILIHFSD